MSTSSHCRVVFGGAKSLGPTREAGSEVSGFALAHAEHSHVPCQTVFQGKVCPGTPIALDECLCERETLVSLLYLVAVVTHCSLLSIMTDKLKETIDGSKAYTFKKALKPCRGAEEAIAAHEEGESVLRVFSLRVHYFPESKEAQMRELKYGAALSGQKVFVKQREHIFSNGHLIIPYENFFGREIPSIITLLDSTPTYVVAMKDILSAVILLREKGLVHCEFNKSNVVFLDGYFKLNGFELCVPIGGATLPAVLGPHAAPETLLRGLFTHLSMVFSLGLILFEMVTKRPAVPIERLDHLQNFYRNCKRLSLDFPAEMNPQLRSLISACLEVEYQSRPKLNELREAIEVLIPTVVQSLVQHRRNLLFKVREATGSRRIARKNSSPSISSKPASGFLTRRPASEDRRGSQGWSFSLLLMRLSQHFIRLSRQTRTPWRSSVMQPMLRSSTLSSRGRRCSARRRSST